MTAAVRKTPTQANGGADDGIDYTNGVDAEIEALWKSIVAWLTSIGGTGNAVTASSDTSLVGPIAAYARPMSFYYAPANANTGAVTINIDSVGVANIKDQFGAALQGGEFSTSGAYLLVYDGTNFRAVGVTAGAANRPVTQPDVLVQEQQSSGVNSHNNATFTSGAYRQRFLNTTVRNNIGATISSNQITLPAGTYYATWRCPAFAVNHHQTRLYNVTDSTVLAYGSTAYALQAASDPVSSQTDSEGSAIFTLSTSKVIELDHYCSSTVTTEGFGIAAGFGNAEVYSEIRIWKQ